MKFLRIEFKKKKSNLAPKLIFGALLLLVVSYVSVELFSAKLITKFFGDKIAPHHFTIGDIDLHPLKGEIEVQKIEVFRKSGTRLGVIESFSFAPRFKNKNISFHEIDLRDAHFSVATSDIPENIQKKSEPLKIKPEFEKISVRNVVFELLGVPGVAGDKNFTLRGINGNVDCKGEKLCLSNEFKVQAVPVKGSIANIDGNLDVKNQKMVDVRASVRNISLVVFNSLLSSSSPVTAESGKVDLFTEYHLKGSSGEGYFKFYVEDLEFQENEETKAGFLAKLAGNIIADRKIDHFDIRLPVIVKNNAFKLEQVDIKEEIKRIFSGRMLPKGFDNEKQAQEEN